MSKEATRARIVKQSMKNQEKYESKLMSLIDQIDSQKNIISDAGKGSRRANTAQKKIDSIRKKLDKLADKKHHDTSRIIKDKDLVDIYGESAMEARSFGTDRGVDYDLENYYPEGLHIKDPPIKSTHKLDRKKWKAKGGYVKKYAKGGGVRKVRS